MGGGIKQFWEGTLVGGGIQQFLEGTLVGGREYWWEVESNNFGGEH